MRGEHAPVDLTQRAGVGLLLEHVDGRPAEVTALEYLVEVALVDDPAARCVDEERIWLHLLELRAADHAAGLPGEGQVKADDIGLAVDLLLAHPLEPELGHEVGAGVQVVDEDPRRAEDSQPAQHPTPDATSADDADRHLGDAPAHQPLPLAAVHLEVRHVRVAQERQDEPDGELGNGRSGCFRGVRHRDASLPGGEEVDIVEADADTGDELEVRCGVHHLRRDWLGAGDEDLGIGDKARQLVLGEAPADGVDDVVDADALEKVERKAIVDGERHRRDEDSGHVGSLFAREPGEGADRIGQPVEVGDHRATPR